jgi:hypothetical protein
VIDFAGAWWIKRGHAVADVDLLPAGCRNIADRLGENPGAHSASLVKAGLASPGVRLGSGRLPAKVAHPEVASVIVATRVART